MVNWIIIWIATASLEQAARGADSTDSARTMTVASYYFGNIGRGFLKATNNHHIKFAFMWANHDWLA